MQQSRRAAMLLAACVGAWVASPAFSAIVINEFAYDDTVLTTDDREFVELYNNGPAAVDISGWTLVSEDQTAGSVLLGTIPAATTLNPGAYYVISSAAVLNSNQTLAAAIQNDMETIELKDAAAVLMDAVVYEANKGSFSIASLTSQVGNGIWSNSQHPDLGGNNVTVALGRYIDGRDTNSNGRDFGLRPATPGAANNTGIMTAYAPPNVDAQADGTDVAGLRGSFVNPRVITPGVVDANNLNAIPAAPGLTKAIIAWDPSGGGNGAVSEQVYQGTGSFAIKAYLDTNDLPVQTNATGVQFRGSEITMYGLMGGGDALTNLADVSGQVGIGTGTTSSSNSANGATGVMWYYEKVGVSAAGAPVSEKLYLVDAGDGGNGNSAGGSVPFDWTVLQTIDLSALSSDWHDLSISIDALGNGVATFDNLVFNFTTAPDLVGSFYVGYRENLQNGSDGTPDAIIRPATFAVVPEPAIFGIMAVSGLLTLRRSRR